MSTVALGEICRTTSGGTPSRKRSDFFQGAIPWVKSGELNDGNVSEVDEFITEEAIASSSAKVFPAGTLLIALYGATVGKLGILSRAAATNQAVCAIFPPSDLDTKFLFWNLRSRRADLIAQAVGGAQPNISQAILRGLEISVPPLNVQRETVAEIEKQFSRLDEAVAGLKRIKANLKRYKAAILKAAVESRLVPTEADLARREGRNYETGAQLLQRILDARRKQWQGKGKYKEPAAPDTTDLPELPEGWSAALMSSIAETASGGTPSRSKPFYYGGSIPWVKSGELRDGIVKCTEETITEEGLANSSAKIFPGGTLCIALYGATVGKLGELGIDAATNQAVCGVFPAVGVAPAYLRIFLEASRQVLIRMGQGGAQPNISQDILRGLTVPIPPNAEQHRIVAEVDRLLSIAREAEAQVETNLKRAQALRQATLQAAFATSSPERQ